LTAVGTVLLAIVTVAGAEASATRPRPAACVKQVTSGTRPVSRADAVLLCAQPQAVTATVGGRWSTCGATPPGADEDCETGSWTARYRSVGALRVNGLSNGTSTWFGAATGTLTCRRDRANTDPDPPGTPLVERFHRTGSFPIRQVTVAAAARGSRVVVTADGAVVGAASNRAVETCGPTLLGSSDPTTAGKAVDPGALLRKGTVRATFRQSGTVGTVAALVGGPLRGSVTVTAAIAFRG
jgi:hypothetical protein